MPGPFYLPASRSVGLTEELVWFGQTKPGRVLRELAQPEGVPGSEDARSPGCAIWVSLATIFALRRYQAAFKSAPG